MVINSDGRRISIGCMRRGGIIQNSFNYLLTNQNQNFLLDLKNKIMSIHSIQILIYAIR